MWTLLSKTLDLLAPTTCALCLRRVRQGWLCSTCSPHSVTHFLIPRCPYCFTPLHDCFCPACAVSPLPFHSIRYLCDFSPLIRALVHEMKYRNNERVCRKVGAMIGELLIPSFDQKDWDYILPLPSSKTALKRRLYNQSLVLARGVKRHGKLAGRISPLILLHSGYSAPQATLLPHQRIRNVRGAFKATDRVREKKILLVEDVITTGATTAAAATALFASGATRVDVIALSRVERWHNFRAKIFRAFPPLLPEEKGVEASMRRINVTERDGMSDIGEQFTELVEIVARLRDPKEGCPWDLQQTHESLRKYLIEESYEVIDAIDNDQNSLPKELGDVLLQVVLHAQLGTDAKTFSISDVISNISDKLIRRHPHVFSGVTIETADEVGKAWEKIKADEREDKSIISGVPARMPALMRAQRISEKAARAGFEWPTLEGIRDQILDEVREFVEESISPDADPGKVKDEFGDILFSLIQLARRLNFDGEEALHLSTDKFSRRFRRMEELAKPQGIPDLSLEELDALWKQVKREPGMDR